MTEYEFQIIIKLGHGEQIDAFLDALYEAGCDDAIVGSGLAQYLGIDFIRAGDSAETALKTAIRDIKKAIPHAKLVRAEPYLLNLSGLAFLFGYTKQNMRKYARGEIVTVETDFPEPIIAGKTSYWHAAEVAQWFDEQHTIVISKEMLETLFAVRCFNQAIENIHRPDAEMTASFMDLLQKVA